MQTPSARTVVGRAARPNLRRRLAHPRQIASVSHVIKRPAQVASLKAHAARPPRTASVSTAVEHAQRPSSSRLFATLLTIALAADAHSVWGLHLHPRRARPQMTRPALPAELRAHQTNLRASHAHQRRIACAHFARISALNRRTAAASAAVVTLASLLLDLSQGRAPLAQIASAQSALGSAPMGNSSPRPAAQLLTECAPIARSVPPDHSHRRCAPLHPTVHAPDAQSCACPTSLKRCPVAVILTANASDARQPVPEACSSVGRAQYPRICSALS
mmetsp:Transcript_32779/g.99060  ORF Transcript_32779/g.99060 Transcript_32779/m.99060 type:complete len:275 (+) Transcript_32779:3989-4813(+)